MEMLLYRGSDTHNQFENEVYFSTSKRFSEEYGSVKQYKVKIINLFDTVNREHVDLLLNRYGKLSDPYDNKIYRSYEEYCNSALFGSDTWEMFESYLKDIKQMGFQTMRIFEGGIENFVVLHKEFELET